MDVGEATTALARLPLFADVDPARLTKLAAAGEERRLRPGQELVHAGEPGVEVLVVLAGEGRVTTDGVTVGSVSAGDCVGEMAALDGSPHSATVEAAGPLRALSLPATAFRALVDAEPAVARRLAALLTSRLRQAQSEWALLANGPEEADPLARLTPAEQRVALLVADGLSNAQIADRLVLSRHTVDSHVKHALAKLGVRNRVALATVVSRG